MQTLRKSQITRSVNNLCAALGVATLVFGSATVQADTIIFNQNFNSFSDGTPLTAVPGWYNAGPVPTIVDGQVLTPGGGYNDSYVDLGGDIFSHGFDHVKISWDSFLPLSGEYNMLLGSGTASVPEITFGSQVMGFQRGWYDNHYFYAWVPNTYFDYDDVAALTGLQLPASITHFVVDATKVGNAVTWGAYFQPMNELGVYADDGNPLWTGSSANARFADITDPRGINTLNFFVNEAGHTLDNVKVVGVPEPSSVLLMAAGGLSLFMRRTRKARK